jgi:glycogen debranching enzyme
MAKPPPDLRNEIKVFEGNSFFVSDDCGNVHDAGPYGLFYNDTRFLSRYWVEVNGQRPWVLTSKAVDFFSAAFFLANPPLDGAGANTVSVVRHRFLGDGVHEDLIIRNHNVNPVSLQISFFIDCDFADHFEVKEDRIRKKRTITCELDEAAHTLRYTYRRDGFLRGTVIAFSEKPRLEHHRATFDISVSAKGEWRTCVRIALVTEAGERQPKYRCDAFTPAATVATPPMERWHRAAPRLLSDCDWLNHTYQQSCLDLAALHLRVEGGGDVVWLPAGGLPWFMTIFGRDTLITAYQGLPLHPNLAHGALRALAVRQGTRVDDFRDEEPGKVPHEMRFGELTAFGDTPHSPYYGTADATPLFLILLHEYYRWTADRKLVEDLKGNARRAIEWIDRYGDLDGDGYVEYESRSCEGLRNQGWKDSADSVLFSDGTLAAAPIAPCEVQGYVYDAKLRTAELAEEVWGDRNLAERLRDEAVLLKKRFNRDFWVERRSGYFALALDGEKRRVDSLTSNIGHLLWSGIVEDNRAEAVVRQLMSEALYSGWGVRTLSSDDGGFNPIAYHNGTVWPHDNSIIATGLARYGYRAEANRITSDLLKAAASFEYRLPEAFAGYSRERYPFPVRYPTSSSPQAWAAGAPILLLRTMIGLEPDRVGRRLTVSPVLPEIVRRIEFRGVRAFGKAYDVSVTNGQSRVTDRAGDEAAVEAGEESHPVMPNHGVGE